MDHLNNEEKGKLLSTLNKYPKLFQGGLGTFNTTPVDIELKPGEKPVNLKPFPVPVIRRKTFQKEIVRLVSVVILRRNTDSQWASPSFIIPKKDTSVRFLTDFREVNKKSLENHFLYQK